MKKTNKQFDPFKNLILDEYEKEIEVSLERGEWVPTENQEAMKEMFKEAATRHRQLQESKKITFRINQRDLILLKVKAKDTNIPYQTLLGALIRDYVDGEYKITL
ncbi:hypothetical protein COY15_03170 [Candidatus Roizmanbacteria bacterium CG_4_10_14_0_2_um_filter_39_12]|nr:MAG: hypothetical protein COY15_03170 [Candidatus Roizmanbacteria bacterium CG_4_10_14_0_2_um_filter_39_12]